MISRDNNDKTYSMPFLILAEGRDAQMFCIWYLNSAELKDNPAFSSSIGVVDFGGNQELKRALSTITSTDSFEKTKALMILRDTEKDPKKAVSEIKDALKKVKLDIPDHAGEWTIGNPAISYLLFPSFISEDEPGTLEDLCIEMLKEKDSESLKSDIKDFMDNLGNKRGRTFKRIHKTLLHTYFSITDDFVSLKIGEAAKANAFDWGSDRLNPFRVHLESGLKYIN